MRIRARPISPQELFERGRQAAFRWLERRGIGDIGEPTGGTLFANFGSPPILDRPIEGPFFASFDDPAATRASLQRVDPEFETRLRARADRILSGRLDLLGFRNVAVPEPFDWHLDPTTGIRSPDRHWSRIDYLDPAVVGDHKVIWELGRHQALLTLAQAWFITSEAEYAKRCAAALTSFLDATSPKRSIHWASSLELAFRSITWTWILALAGDQFPKELQLRMLAHLAIAGRHIERHLSRWFSPNTHLTGEALGLFVLGTALPQLRDASRWREIGSGLLIEWLPRHVRPDGTYVEQSTWYHRYTTDFYLHFFILAERSSWRPAKQVAEPLIRLLDVLAWLTRPDGTMPLIGDDDGGRLLFLDEDTAHNTRNPLCVGASLFSRCEFAAIARTPTPELVWLLGPEGLQRFNAIPHAPPGKRSKAFPDGGLHVIRSGWRPESSMMTIDAGPHGFLNGGHAHADALSIDFSLQGQPVFVDPGTFTYTSSADKRDHFRRTSSHSAAVLDGQESAVPAGPFQWTSRTTAQAEAWCERDAITLFAGSHDGFGQPADVRYVRIVAFIQPDLWIVRDEVHAEGDHELVVHWQCAPGIRALNEVDSIRLELATGFADMRVVEPGGQWSVRSGNVSNMYGALQDAPHLEYRRRGRAPFAVTTVIADGVVPHATAPGGPGMPVTQLSWQDRHGILVTRGSARLDWLETDAAVAWVEFVDASRPANVVAAGVRTLTISGTELLAGEAVLPGFSARRESPPYETWTTD